jgi:hypothetical protein
MVIFNYINHLTLVLAVPVAGLPPIPGNLTVVDRRQRCIYLHNQLLINVLSQLPELPHFCERIGQIDNQPSETDTGCSTGMEGESLAEDHLADSN